jgi:hypothetical protein
LLLLLGQRLYILDNLAPMPHTRSRRTAGLIINDLENYYEIATRSACDDESTRLSGECNCHPNL